MPAKIPLPPKDLAEVRQLARLYVGTHGLTHSQTAAVINKKKNLLRKFRYELNKSKVIGICHREKVTKASALSEEGKALLKEAGFEVPERKAGLPRSGKNGMQNRLMNAKLRKQSPVGGLGPQGPEVQPTDNKYGKSSGFLGARERRLRGLTEGEAGGHMPAPDNELSAADIQFLERNLYK